MKQTFHKKCQNNIISGVYLLNIIVLLQLFTYPVYGATTIKAGIESVTASFIPAKPTTEFYGFGAEFEITENWQINGDFYMTSIEGLLSHLSLSLGYKINADYPFDIAPYIFAGIDPFFSQIKDLGEIGFTYHVGLGINYVFENTFCTSFITKLYLTSPFPNEKFEHNFNMGTIGLNLNIGYKF